MTTLRRWAAILTLSLMFEGALLGHSREAHADDMMIKRAQTWVDSRVPYSTTAQFKNEYGTYRTDCAGYVSMAWQLPEPGTNVSGIIARADPIAKEELQPGDVLVNDGIHVVMFARWANSSQTQYMAYEEPDVGEVARLYPIPYPYWSNLSPERYRPYRKKGANTSVSSFTTGSFLSSPNGDVYRVVGGAPIYVSSWAAVGGQQPTIPVSELQLSSMRRFPVDGTFVVDAAGSVYVFAGGAPIYVSSWASVGNPNVSPTRVDQYTLEHPQPTGPLGHSLFNPRDGTILLAGSSRYVVKSGLAQISQLSSGGTRIDPAAITYAGNPGVWAHLR